MEKVTSNENYLIEQKTFAYINLLKKRIIDYGIEVNENFNSSLDQYIRMYKFYLSLDSIDFQIDTTVEFEEFTDLLTQLVSNKEKRKSIRFENDIYLMNEIVSHINNNLDAILELNKKYNPLLKLYLKNKQVYKLIKDSLVLNLKELPKSEVIFASLCNIYSSLDTLSEDSPYYKLFYKPIFVITEGLGQSIIMIKSKKIVPTKFYNLSHFNQIVPRLEALINLYEERSSLGLNENLESQLLESEDTNLSILHEVYSISLLFLGLDTQTVLKYQNANYNTISKLKADLKFKNGEYNPEDYDKKVKKDASTQPYQVRRVFYGHKG
jgi:hypothetical protein